MIPARSILTFFTALLLLLGVHETTLAQNTESKKINTYTFIFKGEPIEKALQQLVQTTGLDLIYDPAIIPHHNVFKTTKRESPENILRKILDGSGLDFIQLSSGTYVLTATSKVAAMQGNLAGRVVDNQSGKPLRDANIMLADASGGTATNGNGHFTIPDLERGFHPITITYVGYQPVRDTVWVPGNATTSMQYSLELKPVLVEPMVVSGIQKQSPAVHSKEITTSKLVQQATGTADAVKSLNTVSGINFSLPLADFNIQGGNNGEHELRLDGVPIYNPVSMGRLLGAFSPYAIQKIEISKAGFEAAAGSQLSGIVNIRQDASNKTGNTLLLQADPMSINGRLDLSIGDKDEGPAANIMLASRLNIWPLYQEPNVQNTLQDWDQLDPLITMNLLNADSTDSYFEPRRNSYDITYYDLHAAARIEHTPFHQTRISAYHGKNLLKTDLYSETVIAASAFSADLFYSKDRYDWTNSMAKIEHEWLINSRLDANMGAFVTYHTLDHNYAFNKALTTALYDEGHSPPNQFALEDFTTGNQNAMRETSANFSLSYTATKNYTVEGGLQATHLRYRYKLSDLYYNTPQSSNSSFLISGYLQNKLFLSDQTTLIAGNRFTFVPSRDLVFAEPRLSLEYDKPDASIGYWSAKISGGIYRQFINQFDVSNVGPSALVPSIRFWVPADYTTTVPKAYHLAFDGLWEPDESWNIQLESYYKLIPSRLALDYNILSGFPALLESGTLSSQTNFITQTNGYAFGAGISFNKRFSAPKLEVSAGYQFSRARQQFPDRFGGTYQPLPSTQPHKADVSVNWRPVQNLTLLLQWQGIWGRSWGFRKAYYDYLSIRDDPSFGIYSFTNPGDDTLPRYSRLNTGISYRLDAKSADLQFRLNIFNLLGHNNVINWWLSPYRNEQGTLSYRKHERTMVGFQPSLSIKLRY